MRARKGFFLPPAVTLSHRFISLAAASHFPLAYAFEHGRGGEVAFAEVHDPRGAGDGPVVGFILKIGGEAFHVTQGVQQVFRKVPASLFAGDWRVVLVAEVPVADGPVSGRAEVGRGGEAFPFRPDHVGDRMGQAGVERGDDGAFLLLLLWGDGVSRPKTRDRATLRSTARV